MEAYHFIDDCFISVIVIADVKHFS